MIEEGKKAPTFTLKDKNGDKHKLSDTSAKFTIVYFYPKDNTPGCTLEAQAFNRDLKKYEQLNAQIYGISGGDDDSKSKFCQKYDLNLVLLSDPEFKISSKYGVYGEKQFMGRTSMGIARKTFVLDQDQKVLKIYHKVKPEEHSKEVLKFIQSL